MTFVAMQRAALLCSELPERTEGYHCWQMTTPVPAASGLLIGAYASREPIVTPDMPVVFFRAPKAQLLQGDDNSSVRRAVGSHGPASASARSSA